MIGIPITTARGPMGIFPPAVLDYANRVVTNGGARPSTASLAVLSQFYNGLVVKRLLQYVDVFVPVTPDSLIAAITPLINNGGNDPWTNTDFVSGDLTVDGLIGDGASKYLDTGYVPGSVLTSDSNGGLGFYVSANDTNAGESDFNVSVDAAHAMALYCSYGGTCYCDIFSQSSGAGRISAGNSGYVGWISGHRGSLDSGNAMAVYTGNSTNGHSVLVTSTGNGGSRPSASIYAYAQNNPGSGVPIQYATKRYSAFVIFNTGLLTAQDSDMYNLVQNMRVGFGGGYV